MYGGQKMKKFTLIELLVVIAIIGILLSLLLPSFGQAREKAKQIVCLGNMKQISVAVEMYKSDSNNRLPKCVMAVATNWAGAGNNQAWKGFLNLYLNQALDSNGDLTLGVFDCPSRNKDYATGGGLGWNIDYLKYDPIDANNPDRQIYYGYKFFSITDPEATMLVGDTTDDNAWEARVCRKPNGILSRIGNRHSTKTNILWADSHVTTESPVKMANGKSGKQNYYYLADKENQN